MLPFLSITQHQRLIRASRAGVSAKSPPKKLQDDRQIHQGAPAPQSLQRAPRAAQAQETPPAGGVSMLPRPQRPAGGLKHGAAKAQRTKKSAQRTTYAAQRTRNGRQEAPSRRPRLRNRMLTMPREQPVAYDEYDQDTLDRMEMDLHPERIWQSTGPIHDCPCNAPKGKPCTCH